MRLMRLSFYLQHHTLRFVSPVCRATQLDTSRNPAAAADEGGLRLLRRQREGSEVCSAGAGATTAVWSLAWRADRYAGAALLLSQTNRFML
jgi:hypothetical protein